MSYLNRNLVANPLDTGQTTALSIWKAHFLELHNELIASGWVQTSDTGQLDISAVATTPAKDVYVGYRMYEINDDLSADGYKIYMKLEFGSYSESASTSYHPGYTCSVKTSFGMKTDGTGGLLSQASTTLTPATVIRHPQSVSGVSNISTFIRPNSYVYTCKNNDKGFFGIVFYCNGRGQFGPAIPGNWYNAATLAVFVQRSLDDSGVPNADGFTVYMPAGITGSSRWPSNFQANSTLNSTIGYSYANNAIVTTLHGQVRPSGIDGGPVGGNVQVGPCYTYCDSQLKFNPNLVTVRSLDLGEGAQFQIEVAPGDVRNFIMLGPGTGMNPDTLGNQNSFAMLYE